MSYEAEWRKEWEVLRAERAVARRRWRSAADELTERAHDPFGLRKLIADHPVVATGIGAAAGALLVKLLFGRSGKSRDGSSQRNGAPHDDDDTAKGPAANVWSTILRDAALRIAVPWLLNWVREKFGQDLDPKAAPGPVTTDAPSAARATDLTPA